MRSDLNLAYIQELVGEDPELIKSFLSDIINQLKDTGHQMHELVGAKNLNELANVAHKLKSSIQVVGANSLHAKLYELETASKEEESDISTILALYESVESLRQNCLKNLEAAI